VTLTSDHGPEVAKVWGPGALLGCATCQENWGAYILAWSFSGARSLKSRRLNV
jgi:hypothetical protein